SGAGGIGGGGGPLGPAAQGPYAAASLLLRRLSDGGAGRSAAPKSRHRPQPADPGPAEAGPAAEGGTMNFPEIYARMNQPLRPSPALVEQTLAHTKHHRRPWRRIGAAALAAALLLATPALAVRTEAGYELLYRSAPAVAQFFQPVR